MEASTGLASWIEFSAGALSFSSPSLLLLPSYITYTAGRTFFSGFRKLSENDHEI
jgi:hypothetical protein